MLRSAWSTGVLLAAATALGACGPDRENEFDSGRPTDARADATHTDTTTGHDVAPLHDGSVGTDVPIAHDVVVGHDAAPTTDTGGATCETLECSSADECNSVCPAAPSGYMNCCYHSTCTQYMGACPASTGTDGGSTGGTCMMTSCSSDDDCASCSGGATCCLSIGPGAPGFCTPPMPGFCGGTMGTDAGTGGTCTPFSTTCTTAADCAGCGAGSMCFAGICF